MKTLTHPSNFFINPISHYEKINNLRILAGNMESKLSVAVAKGLSEDKEIEAKGSIVTVSTSIIYISEMFNKLEQMEKQLTEQKIINLNLLISNREKEAKITDLIERNL